MADAAVMPPIRRALSVRQPWAEQILLGVKTAELRPRPTRVVGEPFYLYAAKTPGPAAEFARIDSAVGDLPTGLLVGVATVAGCSPLDTDHGAWAWHLTDVRRLATPTPPDRHPQPTFFHAFASEVALPLEERRRHPRPAA